MLEHYMPILADDTVAGSFVPDEETVLAGGLLSGTVAMPRALYVKADNYVTILGLRDAYSGVYANTATVSAVLKNSVGTAMTLAIDCEYQSGSDGEYVGVIDSSKVQGVVVGDTYYVDIDIDVGDYKDFRRVEIKGRYHGVE